MWLLDLSFLHMSDKCRGRKGVGQNRKTFLPAVPIHLSIICGLAAAAVAEAAAALVGLKDHRNDTDFDLKV